VIAVTFDFGQTLAELDHAFLARRASERGVHIDHERARTETPAAWTAYGEAKRNGLAGHDAWCTFMRTLLERCGLTSPLADDLAEWFWTEQPRVNLWRKPIPGMFELAIELRERGVPVGIVSNSEGKLAELAAELGHTHTFLVIADSGVLGIEKPDPRIFQFAASALGVATNEIVHVGDSWEADIVGAMNANARAIWFQPSESRELSPRVRRADDASEVRAALRDFGVPA
jgi:HAD superfamily hydrolase (TIGR01509 family)